MYTKADFLLGKRNMLKLRINRDQPDIIAITKSLPKNKTNTWVDATVEFSIKDYKLMEGNHSNRGVLIYTANHLEVTREEALSAAAHKEQLWCIMRSTDGNRILLRAHIPQPAQYHKEQTTERYVEWHLQRKRQELE